MESGTTVQYRSLIDVGDATARFQTCGPAEKGRITIVYIGEQTPDGFFPCSLPIRPIYVVPLADLIESTD